MLQLEIKVLVIENYPDRDFTRAVSPTWGKVDVSRLPWAELSAAQLPSYVDASNTSPKHAGRQYKIPSKRTVGTDRG